MLKRLIAVAVLVLPWLAQAAVITSVFTPLGGSKWSVELDVTNDSSLTPISEFTVYFSEANFSDLALTGSPVTWDPLIVQRDLDIPAPGFIDGLVLDVGDSLEQGESIGGFKMTFNLLGADKPFALPFEVYDIDFNLLDSAETVVRIADEPGGGTVPEPESSVLAFLGLLGLAIASRPCKVVSTRPT